MEIAFNGVNFNSENRSIEAVQINNVIGALRYIVRRIPLVTQEARDSDYKQMHPYACCTQEEFFNYHLGKQRAHEVMYLLFSHVFP